MENKLKQLFEFQKFEHNSRLDRLISETDARQAAELSDDALSFVSAAGEFAPADPFKPDESLSIEKRTDGDDL